MTAQLPTTEARALAEHESVIKRGLTTFVEIGTALIYAEDRMSEQAFDTYCRVHAGAPAEVVPPFLDIVRGMA